MAADAAPRGRLVLVFALFAAGYFLSYSFRSVGALIGPDLMRELALDAAQLGLLASVYFLTFAIAQPFIGIAMDRHGPARVDGLLMAIAAIGAVIFAASDGLVGLTLGRALIGLGVSGALMTAMKAFVVWYPVSQREALSGAMMAVGGIAAMTVSLPAELAMRVVGWRGLFWVLAGLSAITAMALWWRIPSPREMISSQAQATSGNADASGFRAVFTSRIFIAYAPLALFGSGGFSALQSLWAGPWLIEVTGQTRAQAAQVLFVYGMALFVGYLGIALLGSRIQAIPGAARRLYVGALGIAYAALAVIILNAWPTSSLPWFAYGLTLGAGMLAYPALTKAFPAAIAGRVVTAYNFVMFAGAFVLQWGIGALIQALLNHGVAKVTAYQISFATLLATQVMSLLWFWLVSRTLKTAPG